MAEEPEERIGMKIFISDIHLGDGSKSDDFHRDKELISFLEWTDNRASEIIIVGDLYELWQAHLDKIFWAHDDVVNELSKRSRKITYLFGNHDYLPFAKLTPEKYQSGNITAMHGHQFDKWNKFKNPLRSIKWPVGYWVTLSVAEMGRWIHPDVDVWLKKMRPKFGNFKVDAALLQNKVRNIKDMENLKLNNLNQISIFGHNHQAEVCEIIDVNENYDYKPTTRRIYANCGTWVGDTDPTFIAVTKDVVQLRNGLDYKVINEVSII